MKRQNGAAPLLHGFVLVRSQGRGYRPRQVDERLAQLSQDRDEAWERAARLTVLAKDMQAGVEQLRAEVARMPPQTFEALGGRARQLLVLAEGEACMVRAAAREEADRVAQEAEERARTLRGAARAHADRVRAEADEQARRRLQADRSAAEALRSAARDEALDVRREALAGLRGMRRRADALLAEKQNEHNERLRLAERQFATRECELTARHAELAARAEAGLRAAQQAYAQARRAADRHVEAAREHAGELVAEARMREKEIGRETEQLVREHRAQGERIRRHMNRVLGGLRALPVADPAAGES